MLTQKIIVLGVSHHNTSVDKRALLAWTPGQQTQYLHLIKRMPGVEECVLLLTCNRCECVALVSDEQALKAWWYDKIAALQTSSYFYQDLAAFEHVLYTSCGLDAKIIGEPQILGQLKRAYAFAQAEDSVGPGLTLFFDQVIHYARQIRLSSALGEHVVSLAMLCYREIVDFYDISKPLHVVCVGAGRVIQSQVRLLSDKLNARFSLLCRDVAKHAAFAAVYDMQVHDFSSKQEVLAHADVLISATSSADVLIKATDLASNSSCLLLDLALPRDIDLAIKQYPGCRLLHMDELNVRIEGNMQLREQAAEKAKLLVKHAAGKFFNAWCLRMDNVVLRDFRTQVQRQREQLLLKLQAALAAGADNSDVITQAHIGLGHELSAIFIAFKIPTSLWQSELQALTAAVRVDVYTVDISHYVYKLTQRIMHRPTCWLRERVVASDEKLLQLL